MAVDGSLIFNTKIDASGFGKGVKELSSKTVDLKNKISSTEAAIKNLKAELQQTGNVKVKTKVSEGLEKDLAKANEKLRDFGAQSDEIIRAKTEELGDLYNENALEYLLNQNKEWLSLQKKISAAERDVERYKKALIQANESAPLAKDTAEFKSKEQRLADLSGQLEVYRARLSEAERAESAQSAQTASSSVRLETAKSKLYHTISALKLLTNGARRAGNALKSAFSATVGKVISNIGNHFRKANKSANVLEKSLRRIKNTLVRMFFFRLVHSPIDAVKDGLGEIAKVSPEVNKNLSALKTESTYLKNSLASLAAPLLNLVTPAFTAFMGALSGAATKAAQLVAVLSGQSGFVKAVKVQQDYAESLNESTKAAKENQKALAGFDELNVLDQGDAAADESAAPMFENLDTHMNGLSSTLLNAFKNQDFGAIGKMIGEKINGALKKINWGKIKGTLKKWAGNIADFFNGFLAGVDWSLVGTTIANGVAAGLEFAQTLVHRFDFSQFGTAIGALINGFLSPQNAGNLADTISTFFTGILTTMTNLVNTVDWGKVSDSIIAFISNFKPESIGRWATNLLNGLATALQKMDFKSIGAAFRKGIERINWKNIWNGVTRLFTEALQGLADFFGLEGVNTANLKKTLQDIYQPVVNIWKTLKDTTGKLLKPIINQFLPAAVKFCGSILSGITPIISAATPMLEKVIEVASTVIESLAPVVETIGGVIASTVNLLSPVIRPLLDLIGNVSKLLAPAVGGILGAVKGVTDFFQPITDFVGRIGDGISDFFGMLSGDNGNTPTISAKLQEELDHLAKASGDLVTVKDNMQSAIKSVDESLAGTKDDLGYIDELQGRLKELMGKAVLTDEDIGEIKTIADLLGDKLPGFKKEWENIIGEDGLNKDTFVENREKMSASIDQVINDLKKQYLTEALQDQYKELYKQKIDANQRVAESISELEDNYDSLNEKIVAYEYQDEYVKRLEADFQKAATETNKLGQIDNEKADKLRDALEKAQKKLGTMKAESDAAKDALRDFESNTLAAKGAQEQMDRKLQELNDTIAVTDGRFKANKDNLQKLRNVYNNGFIDLDEIKKQFGITADELFKGTKNAAEYSADGFREGIENGADELKKMGIDISQDVIDGAMEGLDAHSPSKEFEKIGGYTVEGMEEGVKTCTPKLISLVKSLAGKITAAMKAGLSGFGAAFDFLPELVRGKFNLILTEFEGFLSRITSGINTTFLQINQLNRAFASSGGRSGSYTTYSPLSSISVPKLATGMVIPANYGEFLAILGDNKRESEVVAPVSAIKQALSEAMEERGSSEAPGVINLFINGDKLFTWLIGENNRYKKSHGISAFEGGGN